MNRHKKLPPLEQIKEHGLDYNHKLIDLSNQMYEIGRADYCHPEEILHAFNYIYDCLESLKHTQEAMMQIVRSAYKVSDSPDARMLKAFRDDLKLTQQQLADDLGVSREIVSKWENGRFKMNDKNRIKIQDYINKTKEQNNESI